MLEVDVNHCFGISQCRVDAFAGNQDLGPVGFLHAAECFTPDLLVPLSDEMPAAAADPRVRVGVTRSLRYMLTSLPCPALYSA